MKGLARCLVWLFFLVFLVDNASSTLRRQEAEQDLDDDDDGDNKKFSNMTVAKTEGHHKVVAKMRRQLIMDDFVPLSCNNNAGLNTCVSWTSVFGDAAQFSERVVVDCGVCISMDHPGPELTLLQGIDIRGKLVFEEGYAIMLQTASITVQGELEMHSTDPINGTPMIHILMIGTESQSFTPIGENSAICSAMPNQECAVDRKAITVAGGKVNSMSRPRSLDLVFCVVGLIAPSSASHQFVWHILSSSCSLFRSSWLQLRDSHMAATL